VVLYEIAGVAWATTPLEEVITKGLYRYSRHPIYLAIFIQITGVGIASASWIFLLMVGVYTVLSLLLVEPEEQSCLERYGDSYREYMDRTPRWLGIPKRGLKRQAMSSGPS
jgi:protein-S-isoprenylcysteine O-methyltransferase Ste14